MAAGPVTTIAARGGTDALRWSRLQRADCSPGPVGSVTPTRHGENAKRRMHATANTTNTPRPHARVHVPAIVQGLPSSSGCVRWRLMGPSCAATPSSSALSGGTREPEQARRQLFCFCPLALCCHAHAPAPGHAQRACGGPSHRHAQRLGLHLCPRCASRQRLAESPVAGAVAVAAAIAAATSAAAAAAEAAAAAAVAVAVRQARTTAGPVPHLRTLVSDDIAAPRRQSQ